MAVIGRIDIGHPREYACRLFVELVRLLPERTSQVSKPIRVLRLSGIKRDQLAIRIERFIVMRQPGGGIGSEDGVGRGGDGARGRGGDFAHSPRRPIAPSRSSPGISLPQLALFR